VLMALNHLAESGNSDEGTALLHPLSPAQIDPDWGAAVGALAWRALLLRLSLVDRHLELVRVLLGVPALGAFDTHPDDYRDFIVHTDKRASCGVVSEAIISAEFAQILEAWRRH
jgi:hypothetical protein